MAYSVRRFLPRYTGPPKLHSAQCTHAQCILQSIVHWQAWQAAGIDRYDQLDQIPEVRNLRPMVRVSRLACRLEPLIPYVVLIPAATHATDPRSNSPTTYHIITSTFRISLTQPSYHSAHTPIYPHTTYLRHSGFHTYHPGFSVVKGCQGVPDSLDLPLPALPALPSVLLRAF